MGKEDQSQEGERSCEPFGSSGMINDGKWNTVVSVERIFGAGCEIFMNPFRDGMRGGTSWPQKKKCVFGVVELE